jgi:glutamine amidotransferase
MIAILDYNMGNVSSVKNMLKKLGFDAEVVSSPSVLKQASKIIVPGVGSFDYGVHSLDQLGLTEVIKEKAFVEKTPILGICLGMQLLTNGSEEGELPGLGLIEGYTQRFSRKIIEKNYKIPHMGWNFIEQKNDSRLLDDLDSESRFYFVHSYHVICDNDISSIAVANYGYEFTCVIQKENVYGVQFHPEKSHRYGMQLLKNFVELT